MLFMKWGNSQERAAVSKQRGKSIYLMFVGFIKEVFTIEFCTQFDSENSYGIKLLNIFKATWFIDPSQFLSECYELFSVASLVTQAARIQVPEKFKVKMCCLFRQQFTGDF